MVQYISPVQLASTATHPPILHHTTQYAAHVAQRKAYTVHSPLLFSTLLSLLYSLSPLLFSLSPLLSPPLLSSSLLFLTYARHGAAGICKGRSPDLLHSQYSAL